MQKQKNNPKQMPKNTEAPLLDWERITHLMESQGLSYGAALKRCERANAQYALAQERATKSKNKKDDAAN